MNMLLRLAALTIVLLGLSGCRQEPTAEPALPPAEGVAKPMDLAPKPPASDSSTDGTTATTSVAPSEAIPR